VTTLAKSESVPSTSVVNGELGRAELDQVRVLQGSDDRVNVVFEELHEFLVADVAGGDDEELLGSAAYEVVVSEVVVLRDDDSVVGIGSAGDLRVRCPVGPARSSVWIASWPTSGRRRAELGAERRSGTSRSAERDMPVAGRLRSELECCEQILAFEVGVVLKDLVDRHPAREQLEKRLDRIAQPPKRRLAVADGGVHGDAIET
jgi:hypothetical protein